ncbi:MAG: hypothetical protein CMM03_11680 [Rhodopirellula sp.]|nr:hypothetical protein [Rhodopirellula sp.]
MSSKKLSLLVLLGSLGYAVLRYNILGDVPYSDLPFFVANKAFAYAGLVILGIAGLQSTSSQRHKLGMGAAWLLTLHALISLALFSPAYFEKFYQSDYPPRLTLAASLSLLSGCIAFVCLIHLWRVSIKTRRGTELSLISGMGRIVIALAAAHTALMGYQVWVMPEKWPGLLPPITLLASLSAVVILIETFKRKNRTFQEEQQEADDGDRV